MSRADYPPTKIEGERPCTKCGTVKPADAFYRASDRTSGRRSTCKVCDVARVNERIAADPEAERRRRAAWYAANPEPQKARSQARRLADIVLDQAYQAARYASNPLPVRARAANRAATKYGATETLTADDLATVLAARECAYCGDTATCVDHIRPLSRGGRNHVDNLVAACKWCNSSKHRRWLTEWDVVRVRRAAFISPKVARELEQQTAALHQQKEHQAA